MTVQVPTLSFFELCLQSGSILAQQTVAKTLEVNKATVANHLTLLGRANPNYCLLPVRTGGKDVLLPQHTRRWGNNPACVVNVRTPNLGTG